MISELQAVALGAVQGLTEFLPVSSSAHLAIIPWLLGWQDPGLAFDVALHLGTLVALLGYYWQQWLRMGHAVLTREFEGIRLVWLLIVASIPGAVFGLLFEKQAETVFRSPLLIAVAAATLGVALWLADRIRPESRKMEDLTLLDAVGIGLSQALALIPGVSRSGITITMGRALRAQRGDAANFSFLMATPIVAGAGLLKARELIHGGLNVPLVAGFLTSALVGWLTIAFLIRFVRTRTYESFAWYRIAFALGVVAVYVTRG